MKEKHLSCHREENMSNCFCKKKKEFKKINSQETLMCIFKIIRRYFPVQDIPLQQKIHPCCEHEGRNVLSFPRMGENGAA